ncbi:hypothetical protein [Saccharibacillus sp. JS10]|uniref:hypothetical protein n=1 Tax=Saccharibacillus sp. JS10 TaxID=2950552 RepID=UPI002109EA3A|nr:hypothetical protein [Saccharibacillus sp. JS10]MCQ4086397.1 hypothetical protein [Saccharibacillus sp. JS10]
MYRKLIATLGITILLGGCGSPVQQAAKPDQDSVKTPEVREYEGAGKTWSAEYSMYMPKDGGHLRARLIASYEGSGPAPIGEVKYSYYGEDIESGSGGKHIKKAPENGVYSLRDMVTTQYKPNDAGTVELLLIWNNGKHSETIRLEPTES